MMKKLCLLEICSWCLFQHIKEVGSLFGENGRTFQRENWMFRWFLATITSPVLIVSSHAHREDNRCGQNSRRPPPRLSITLQRLLGAFRLHWQTKRSSCTFLEACKCFQTFIYFFNSFLSMSGSWQQAEQPRSQQHPTALFGESGGPSGSAEAQIPACTNASWWSASLIGNI